MFDEDTGTVFRDVITLALAGFVAVVILLLPWINPPGSEGKADVAIVGDVMFEISWPSELDVDVDLWVQAPRDVPIGYSNKGGLGCNLLRDDLGRYADPLDVNHEITVCRGIRTEGEYVVNVHLFRTRTEVLPIPVKAQISVRPPAGSPREVARTAVALDRMGREITVLRFRLDADGRPVSDSVHSLYKPLREFRRS